MLICIYWGHIRVISLNPIIPFPNPCRFPIFLHMLSYHASTLLSTCLEMIGVRVGFPNCGLRRIKIIIFLVITGFLLWEIYLEICAITTVHKTPIKYNLSWVFPHYLYPDRESTFYDDAREKERWNWLSKGAKYGVQNIDIFHVLLLCIETLNISFPTIFSLYFIIYMSCNILVWRDRDVISQLHVGSPKSYFHKFATLSLEWRSKGKSRNHLFLAITVLLHKFLLLLLFLTTIPP